MPHDDDYEVVAGTRKWKPASAIAMRAVIAVSIAVFLFRLNDERTSVTVREGEIPGWARASVRVALRFYRERMRFTIIGA